jgi:hypothetical protein
MIACPLPLSGNTEPQVPALIVAIHIVLTKNASHGKKKQLFARR